MHELMYDLVAEVLDRAGRHDLATAVDVALAAQPPAEFQAVIEGGGTRHVCEQHARRLRKLDTEARRVGIKQAVVLTPERGDRPCDFHASPASEKDALKNLKFLVKMAA